MRTVKLYRGRQRQIVRAVIKHMVELQKDAVRGTRTPICNGTVLASYVGPLLAAMETALTTTISR